jgi:hypothetical protein
VTKLVIIFIRVNKKELGRNGVCLWLDQASQVRVHNKAVFSQLSEHKALQCYANPLIFVTIVPTILTWEMPTVSVLKYAQFILVVCDTS